MIRIISILIILFFSSLAWTQDDGLGLASEPESTARVEEAGPAKVKVKGKKISVSFDDELIKGANPNPEVEFIFDRAEFNYRKMIKLRENFIPEAEVGKELFRESN